MRPGAAASILKGVKSGKETYHQLFKKLCRYGIKCYGVVSSWISCEKLVV